MGAWDVNKTYYHRAFKCTDSSNSWEFPRMGATPHTGILRGSSLNTSRALEILGNYKRIAGVRSMMSFFEKSHMNHGPWNPRLQKWTLDFISPNYHMEYRETPVNPSQTHILGASRDPPGLSHLLSSYPWLVMNEGMDPYSSPYITPL